MDRFPEKLRHARKEKELNQTELAQIVGVTHADDLEAAEKMQELIKARLPRCSFLTEEIGAVLGVHIGIGSVGVFFLRKDC